MLISALPPPAARVNKGTRQISYSDIWDVFSDVDAQPVAGCDSGIVDIYSSKCWSYGAFHSDNGAVATLPIDWPSLVCPGAAVARRDDGHAGGVDLPRGRCAFPGRFLTLVFALRVSPQGSLRAVWQLQGRG